MPSSHSAPKQPAITIACPVHGTQPVVMRDGPPQYVLCELCAQHRCPVCGRVCDCEPPVCIHCPLPTRMILATIP